MGVSKHYHLQAFGSINSLGVRPGGGGRSSQMDTLESPTEISRPHFVRCGNRIGVTARVLRPACPGNELLRPPKPHARAVSRAADELDPRLLEHPPQLQKGLSSAWGDVVCFFKTLNSLSREATFLSSFRCTPGQEGARSSDLMPGYHNIAIITSH
jgi:hypothetical protein